MKKRCEICGKKFEARWNSQKYCSDECREYQERLRKKVWRENQKFQAIKPRKIVCAQCGVETMSVGYSRLCGACRRKYIGGVKEESRPLTEDTPFLVQKWLAEGMKEQEIAEVLNRPLRDIQKAKGVRLNEEQREWMPQGWKEKHGLSAGR